MEWLKERENRCVHNAIAKGSLMYDVITYLQSRAHSNSLALAYSSNDHPLRFPISSSNKNKSVLYCRPHLNGMYHQHKLKNRYK